MSDNCLFTADHHGFYRDGHPFFPWIQEQPFPLMDWSNTVFLRLPASLKDDLEWAKEKIQAEQISASGKYILWGIDLELSAFTFAPEDSAAFFSFSIAIEEFTTHFWPMFQKQTFGVVLYCGKCPSERHFPPAIWDPAFLEWANSFHSVSDKALYDLYCIQMLSEYLHRLVAFLPEAILPFALIDVMSVQSPGRVAQLFSKERFEHIQIALRGATCPFSGICWDEGQNAQGYLGKNPRVTEAALATSLGLYLPKDGYIDALFTHELDRLIFKLKQRQTSFRIIPEEKLTEQWDGIDRLIVSSQSISPQGKRKLLGFIAAGGSVITFEETEGKFT
jgi:hypothetical protein